MKTSRTIAAALAALFIVSVLALSMQAAPGPQKGKPEAKPQGKTPWPKEVTAVIQEGLATRQGRQDFPFSIFKTLILPGRDNSVLPVVLLKAKNGDLGYAPAASGSGQMEATLKMGVQLFQPAADGSLKAAMSNGTQVVLTTESENYSPDASDWYSLSLGTALQRNNYTLALVLMTPDMKKISVAYCDIVPPGPEATQNALVLTEPIIATELEPTDPDMRPTLHRGFFMWGALRVKSKMTGEIPVGADLEVFFFVDGASPKDPTTGRLDLELNFEVLGEDGKTAIRWAPASRDAFMVDQPLPLVQTLQKQDEKGTILSTEKKPLPAGKYTLVATVTDKVSGKKGEAKMPFTVI